MLPSDTAGTGSFRRLTPDEIAALDRQGCHADNWELLTVETPFFADRYRNVIFQGEVTLGSAAGETETPAGIRRQCGIYNAVIADCNVGRDVLLNNISGGLRNLDIGDRCVIDSVYSFVCEGESTFGNGSLVNVISETGGREVCMTTALTAPGAYLQAFYRHSATLSNRLQQIASEYTASRRGSRAQVGPEASVTATTEIRNVAILGHSVVSGASRLVNGTIRNAFVGNNVIAEDFIILDGSTVDSGASLHNSFVGQGATVASGFTAHDSLIFSNCHLDNGEAAAAFAGPFTTSMHKSTLLIGGLFSFFNAGSGTNQSNHLYKLGPMHQGVTSRGCKTGSDSYILWPAAIGAFTAILGRHYSHPDTRDFPFSYLLNDKHGESVLIPGAALGSVGLARDVEKWPSRDRRDPALSPLLDPLDFHWLSPYTVQAILKGVDRLKQAADSPEMQADNKIAMDGFLLTRRAIDKGFRNYRIAIDLFTAGILRRKILALTSTNPEITPGQLIGMLRKNPGDSGCGQWVDLAGLLAPRREVDSLEFDSCASLKSALDRLAGNYLSFSWSWGWNNLLRLAEADGSQLSARDVATILRKGVDAAKELERRFVGDAAKEFDPSTAATGFGIDADGNQQEIADDFSRARGSLAGQRFLAQLHRKVITFVGSIENIISVFDEEPREENISITL